MVCYAFFAFKVGVERVRTQVAGNMYYKMNTGAVHVFDF
jgi:hypothetical protein